MFIIVETFVNPGEPSRSSIRVRPLAGQGFPTTMRVECSKSMRESAPVGSRFRLWVTVKNGDERGGSCLYSNYRDPWYLVE